MIRIKIHKYIINIDTAIVAGIILASALFIYQYWK